MLTPTSCRDARTPTVTATAISPGLITSIRHDLLVRTPPSRVPHILGVEGTSVILANRWGVDAEKCLLAALLHDIVKAWPEDVQRQKLEHVTLFPVTETDRQFPKVWHGLLGAQEARDQYGVQDEEVLEAVAFHSTGRRGLGPVGLVIYVADFIEPSRHWKGVEAARAELAPLGIREAARRVAQFKLQRLVQESKPAHPLTREMADWLESLTDER